MPHQWPLVSLAPHSSDGSLLCRWFIRFQQCEEALRDHNLLRYKVWNIALCDCDHDAGKYCEKWSRLFVRLDPGLTRRRHCLGHFLLLKHKTEGLTSCTPVPNGYSQYFSTKLPTVYYTWFTVSTLSVKSVFGHTHTSHVFLNMIITTLVCLVNFRRDDVLGISGWVKFSLSNWHVLELTNEIATEAHHRLFLVNQTEFGFLFLTVWQNNRFGAWPRHKSTCWNASCIHLF